MSLTNHLVDPRLYVLQANTVFAARVNEPDPLVYPLSFIRYDTVTTGAYTDIRDGMTMMIGSAAGLDDYGTVRVSGATGDPATAISIYIGYTPEGIHDGEAVPLDNAYITVLDEYRLWAKVPYIDSNGNIFKDRNLEAEWRTTTPPPVAVAGPSFAATMNPADALITVELDGSGSFATATGATITDYLWEIGDGELVVGSALTDATIYVYFEAGYRWVHLTVTDSEGHSHTTHRLIYSRDPEDDQTLDINIASHRITDNGVTMTVQLLQDAPLADYRPNTPCLIWQTEPDASGDRLHMIFVGYLHDEPQQVTAGRTGNQRRTQLTLYDVAHKLDSLPGFPQSLADDDSRDTALLPDITWSYMVEPTLDKYIHYLLYWHSTALEVADFYWTGTGTAYKFTVLESDAQSLWQQVNQRARAFLPDYCLTCNQTGQIKIVPDPMLQDAADRTSAVQWAITEAYWRSISFTYQKVPRVHWLRANAVLAAWYSELSLDADSRPVLETVWSIAPGATPGQGVGEVSQGHQLALSQTDLNATNGHRYARLNSPYSKVRILMAHNDTTPTFGAMWRLIEPAHKEWVEVTMSADTSPQRGITFTSTRMLPLEVNIRYNHGRTGLLREVELVCEVETVGRPAETVVMTDVPGVGEQPTAEPAPSFGLVTGVEEVAFIRYSSSAQVHVTSNFQSTPPTWSTLTASVTGGSFGTVQSFVVDPFSPGYIDTPGGSIDGWVTSSLGIWRLVDMFGTPAYTLVHTFTNAASTSGERAVIGASFGRYFETGNPWLICVRNRYSSTNPGTWVNYSVDGGATWSSDIQVSIYRDLASGVGERYSDVWLSPRTPGLAYVGAYTSSPAFYNPAPGAIFKTEDWGATWTEITPTLGGGVGFSLHVPWHDNLDEAILYHTNDGRALTSSAHDLHQYRSGSDISATSSSNSFAAFRPQFGIRSLDTNRLRMVMCGTYAADASATDGSVATFVSDDGGDTWTEIQAAEVLSGSTKTQYRQAAFAPNNGDTIFLWGMRLALGYTIDGGTTIEDKTNGAAIGSAEVAGIVGGPTAV